MERFSGHSHHPWAPAAGDCRVETEVPPAFHTICSVDDSQLAQLWDGNGVTMTCSRAAGIPPGRRAVDRESSPKRFPLFVCGARTADTEENTCPLETYRPEKGLPASEPRDPGRQMDNVCRDCHGEVQAPKVQVSILRLEWWHRPVILAFRRVRQEDCCKF